MQQEEGAGGTEQGRPSGESLGPKEKLLWDLSPHPLAASRARSCSRGCQSQAKQGKLILEELLLSKQNSPLLSPQWSGKAPESQGWALA